jgi:gliding motility-associated-like protein
MKKFCLISLLVFFAQFLSFSQQIKRAPGCGVVGFDWKTPTLIPLLDEFTSCQNTNYELRANKKSTAGQYIAPGFDIVASGSTYDITSVRVQAGTTPYQSAYSGGSIFASFPVTFSAPSYSHNIEITAVAASSGDKIDIIDHATGALIKSVPITIGTFIINIPASSIKGTATFSGLGVSNYQLDYPLIGKTDYTFNGYTVFNPSVAGNGTHTITYTWNNGTTACGTASKTVKVSGCPIPPSTCTSCASANCKVVISSAATLPLARATSSSDMASQASTNKITLNIKKGETKTVCVPVTIPSDATDFGFKHAIPGFDTPFDCIGGGEDPSITRTYTLQPVSCSGVNIPPFNPNGGSVGSGFNPEWKVTSTPGPGNVAPGDYIFCFTVNLSATSFCDFQSVVLGYYSNGTPPPPKYVCKPIDFEVYNIPPSPMTPQTKITNYTFTCSDAPVNLVALDAPDKKLPNEWIYPGLILYITPKSGTTTVWGASNTIDLMYNGSLAFNVDVLSLVSNNDDQFIFPVTYAQPGTFSFKINGISSVSSKKFDYIVYNAADGTIADQGTLDNTKKVTINMSPVGTAHFSGPGVTDDPDNGGKGFFDPRVAGAGTHTITYNWDNGTNGTTNCVGKKDLIFTVTGGPSGTATIGDICQGTSPALISIPLASLTGAPTTFSIDWDAAANSAGLRDIIDTTIAASSFKLSNTIVSGTYNGKFSVKNSTCSGTPINISIKVMPNPTISPTTAEICEDATLTLTGSGTEAATNPWVAQNTNVTISATGGQTRTITGVSAGTCDITYKDNSGCSKTVTVIINDNPTLTATPTSILVNGTSSVSVSGGSGIGATSNAWRTLSNTANILSGVTGNTQPITVTGVASGNEDIIYTDNKGCDDTVTIAVSILGCNTITKITPDQTWCQGIDPNALEFSTNETATDGISFVVFPSALRPTTGTAVYAGAVSIKKETPLSGKVSLDLPKLGTIGLGALPVVIPGDYYVYAILNPTPTNTLCRSNDVIKVTIKDTSSPLITITPTLNLNEYTVTWKDVPDAVSYKVDTVTYVKGNVPASPNWKSLPANITANHTLQPPLIFPNIPYGRTLLVQVTPLDVTGVKLTCNSIREKRIDNPNCTNPVLLPLNIPDTVCAGESLEKLIGKISSSSVLVNFEWISSTDCINWSPIILPSSDYDTISTTLFKEQTLEIKNSKRTMNNTFIRLVGYDKVTGQCSDSTLPVKILVNEIPDASISIFPDPAKLCVGDPNPIEVTFQGSKGVQPYRFDFKLDGVAKDTTTATIPGDGKAIYKFNTDKTIDDSVFILEKVTDKNGCNATITNQTVKMQVISIPLLDFQADKTIGCYPLEVIFTDKSDATVLNTDIVWDFGNGDLDSTSLGVVKYIFQKSGDYTINFKSTINGCWDTVQKTNYIRVKDRPEAQFSPKKTNISLIDPEIQFINSSSSNSVYYKWIFGDGSPVSNLENPKHMYIGDGSTGLPDPGKYTVELYAYINQDCWDSTSTIITIDDEQIYYIPNTFTPNGDEKNNTFQPVFTSGYDAQNYHFFVYNRWGELIFESNNPTIGWDGTYGNKLLANDTYTWKLQFKEKMTEKEHFLTGHVNLFK